MRYNVKRPPMGLDRGARAVGNRSSKGEPDEGEPGVPSVLPSDLISSHRSCLC